MFTARTGIIGRRKHVFGLQLTKAISHVDSSGSTLQNTERLDDGRGHAVLRLVDTEVLKRSLRLGSPVSVGGDLDLAKGIALCSCLGHSD